MKFLSRLLLLSLFGWGSVFAQSNLPACQGSDASRWSNCVGTNTFASGNKYVGGYKDGKRNGQGTTTFASGDKYVGEYKDDKLGGQGTYTFANGNIYIGEFKDGKRNGQGTTTSTSGNKYVGEYKDDKLGGQGTYIYANGDRHVGEYRDGKRNGQGTYTFASGNKYVGEYKDDKFNGQGTYTFSDGEKYVGEFKDGKYNGQGTNTLPNSNNYVGEFKDGKRNGQGTFTVANGNKYVGEYKDDKRNGQGTLYSSNGSVINQGIWADNNFVRSEPVQQASVANQTVAVASAQSNLTQTNLPACQGTDSHSWSNCAGTFTHTNGEKYIGEFKDGKYIGQGTYTFPRGDKYVGEFKDGKRNGQGTFTFANGNKYVGEYKDDKRNGQGTEYASNGSISNQGIWADGNFVRTAPVQQATIPNNEIEKIRAGAEVSKRLLAQAEDQNRIQTQLAEIRKRELEEQLKLAKQQNQVAPPTAMTTMANRKALVIGNDSYKSVSKLLNAREDAKSMASSLESVGYKVTLKLDLNEKELKAALRAFSNQVQGGDEVLFFFAGHGVQLGSTNYLLPVDIGSESEAQVKDEAIQLQRVLDDMTEKRAKFTLAMIDACRDNPFKSTGRNIGGRGLAPTTAATGQMVVFSAGTGQQALDRLGNNDKNKNGVFTRTFIKEMQKSGVSIDRIVKNVRNEVAELAKSIGHEQVPAIYDQVLGDFYFKK